ncbi:MAG: hypothetical protein CUN57_00350, partial [Phototrophicales bacterium]
NEAVIHLLKAIGYVFSCGRTSIAKKKHILFTGRDSVTDRTPTPQIVDNVKGWVLKVAPEISDTGHVHIQGFLLMKMGRGYCVLNRERIERLTNTIFKKIYGDLAFDTELWTGYLQRSSYHDCFHYVGCTPEQKGVWQRHKKKRASNHAGERGMQDDRVVPSGSSNEYNGSGDRRSAKKRKRDY